MAQNPSGAFSLIRSGVASELSEVDPDSFERDRRQQHGNPRGRAKKKKIEEPADPLEYQGPWAAPSEPDPQPAQPLDDQFAAAKKVSQANPLLEISEKRDVSAGGEYSVWHLDDGCKEGFLHYPADEGIPLAKPAALPPKAVSHTWIGHSQAVNSIQLFPSTGHLILSGSADHKVKLWNFYGNRRCMRTHFGHSKPVRDAVFLGDGAKFLSCSFDKSVKLWDTESGSCVAKFSTSHLPFALKCTPDQDRFLVSCNDNSVYLYDVRSGELVKTFEGHIGSINSMTFMQGGWPNSFLTSSDDRSLRVWSLQSGKVERFISQPELPAISCIARHPHEEVIACQTSKNQILAFSFHSPDSIVLNQKKKFFGHKLNGYACPIAFSPCGTLISSGDADGGVITWSWSQALFRGRVKACDKVILGMQWHPAEHSAVVACSSDGTIKLLS